MESIRPHYRRVDLQTAETYRRLGRWEDAELSLLAAVTIDPSDAEAYRRLSEISMILKKPAQAREAAVRLVGLDPDDPQRWYFLAEKYRQTGRRRSARRMLQKAARIHKLAGVKNSSSRRPL